MNYTIWNRELDRFEIFGIPYREGYVDDPRIFDCPTQTWDVHRFNTPDNLWVTDPARGDTYCRGAYSARVMDDREARFEWYTKISVDAYNNHDYSALPRIDQLSTLMIASDVMRCGNDIERTHRGKGVCMLAGDGAAKWVSVSTNNWALIVLPVGQGHTTANNDAMKGLWREFDRCR